ncbi:MAG: hypothetical protein ACERKU_07190 [Nitrospirota bacterium]
MALPVCANTGSQETPVPLPLVPKGDMGLVRCSKSRDALNDPKDRQAADGIGWYCPGPCRLLHADPPCDLARQREGCEHTSDEEQLANHVWSFAGDSSRADVHNTFLQPFVS